MDIRKLTKDELLVLAEELGVGVNLKKRKPEMHYAIQEIDFEKDEIVEAWKRYAVLKKNGQTLEKGMNRENKDKLS